MANKLSDEEILQAAEAQQALKQASYNRNFWGIFGWRTQSLVSGIATGIIFGGLIGGAALALPAIFGGIVSWGVVASIAAAGTLLGFAVFDHVGQSAGTVTEVEHRVRKENSKTRATINNLTEQLGLRPLQEEELNNEFEPTVPKPAKKLFSLKTAAIFITLGLAFGALLAFGGAGAGILALFGLAAPAVGATEAVAVGVAASAAASGLKLIGAWQAVGVVTGFCGMVGASFGIGAHVFENIQRSAGNVARGKLAEAQRALRGKDGNAPVYQPAKSKAKDHGITHEDMEKIDALQNGKPKTISPEQIQQQLTAAATAGRTIN